MTLGDLMGRIIDSAPKKEQLPNDPAKVYAATRRLVGLQFWMTRPVPYYTDEFYRRRRAKHFRTALGQH